MIISWIFAFPLQPGWRLARNPMALHGLFMKQVMAVENPWSIYLQTLGNQFVEYESVLVDHSILAHALILLGCFLATNLPETHILWPSERILIFDLLIRGSEKQTYSLYIPQARMDFPLGRSNITLNKPTRHPWRRKKCVPWSFLPHHPKRRRYLWTAPGALGWFPIMVRLSEGP